VQFPNEKGRIKALFFRYPESRAAFGSTTVPRTIHLAGSGPMGSWYLALDHAGVAEEPNLIVVSIPGPGIARFRFETGVAARRPAAGQSARCAAAEVQAKIKELPKTTEAERLVVQRIGQDIFRARLIEYWQGRCPLTGILDTALLRASQIVPWKDCPSDAERLARNLRR
jgi:hypothetical protein